MPPWERYQQPAPGAPAAPINSGRDPADVIAAQASSRGDRNTAVTEARFAYDVGRDQQEDAIKAEEASRLAAAQAAGLTDSAAQIRNVIQAAKNAKGLSNSWFATGFGAEAARNVGGSDAANVQALLNTIGSNTAFDRLQRMREQSPTGGALGAVTETELAMLRDSIASISQSQSDEQFRANMDEVIKSYERVLGRLEPEAQKPAQDDRADPAVLPHMFGGEGTSGGNGGGGALPQDDGDGPLTGGVGEVIFDPSGNEAPADYTGPAFNADGEQIGVITRSEDGNRTWATRQAVEAAGRADATFGQMDSSNIAQANQFYGLTDERDGVGYAIGSALRGDFAFGENYETGRDATRLRLEQASDDAGAMGTVAAIGGALTAPGPWLRPGAVMRAGRSVAALNGGNVTRAGVRNALARTAFKDGALGGSLAGFGHGEGYENSAANALTGAVLGGGIGYAGQRVGNALTARGDVAGAASRAAVRAAPNRGPVASTASDVVEAGQREGVRVMTSDVSPPRGFVGKFVQSTSERIPFAGTGGPRIKQNEERIEAVRNLARDYGVDGTNNFIEDVATDLAKTRGARLTSLTARKNAVIDRVQGSVEAPRAIAEIDRQIANLSGSNADAFAPVIARLQSFRDVLSSGKTLRQVETNRKLLGDLFRDPNLSAIRGEGEKAVSAIYAPLREDMGVIISRNSTAGEYRGWVQANDELAEMAGELETSAFKRVLRDTETTPENIASLLFSKKPSDVRRLMGNLSDGGRNRARSAIIHETIRRASADSGLETISPQRFANAIRDAGGAIGAAFDGPEAARLQGLERLLRATQRASEAAAAPPTGVQNNIPVVAASAITLTGGAAIPIGALWGGMARAYESGPVRNLLLALGKSPAGSASEAKIMARISELLARQSGPLTGRSLGHENGMLPMVVASPEDQPADNGRPPAGNAQNRP